MKPRYKRSKNKCTIVLYFKKKDGYILIGDVIGADIQNHRFKKQSRYSNVCIDCGLTLKAKYKTKNSQSLA